MTMTLLTVITCMPKLWCLTDSPSQPYWWGQSRGLCQESDAGSSDKHCVEPLQSEGQKGEVASD